MTRVDLYKLHGIGSSVYLGEFEFPQVPRVGDLVEVDDDLDGVVQVVVWKRSSGGPFTPEVHLE